MVQKGDVIERTVAKMELSQQKKKEVVEYILQHKPYLLGSAFKSTRIRECCNVLKFRDYLNGEQRLYGANFCKYDKFCLACSTRRSIRMLQRFEQGIQQYRLYDKHWYHITLTVRHNSSQSLKTVMDKLCTAKGKVAKRYRNGKRPEQKTKSFMNNFDGLICSIEVTQSEKGGWHPHIHILACSDKKLPTKVIYLFGKRIELNEDLQNEWHEITKDSYQVSMREITVTDGYFDRKGIGEVFKYAVKFSTLDVPHLVELIELQHTRKYHFFSTYGIFRGWKLDSKPTDEDKNFVEKTLEYFEDEYIQTEETEQTVEISQKKAIDLSEVVEQMEPLSI